MHYVSVEELTKSFGIKPLFSNISFHIEEGDKIALVARNGSGKTTFAREFLPRDAATCAHELDGAIRTAMAPVT
jgi:ATP-binding cassette subfamily F protein uup